MIFLLERKKIFFWEIVMFSFDNNILEKFYFFSPGKSPLYLDEASHPSLKVPASFSREKETSPSIAF